MLRWIIPCLTLALGGCQSLIWFGHSPDRSTRVEVLQKGGRQWVQRGSRPERRYHAIGVAALTFSPDSRRLAYPAQRGDAWCVVVDGRERCGWGGIGEIVFSPNGRHLVYSAKRGSAWRIVRDGQAGQAVSAVLQHTLRFSPDGRHVVHVSQIGRKIHLLVDDRRGPAFDGISQLTLGPYGRVAYVGRSGHEVRVVDGAVPAPAFERVTHLTLSPDGRRLAYLAKRNARWCVVVDGQQGEGYSDAAGLIFSPDSTRVAHAVRVGPEARVVMDGLEGPLVDGIRYETMAFTADGRLGYVARRAGRYHWVLDGRFGPAHDELQAPVVGGNRWGYLARNGSRLIVVLTGKVHLLPPWITWVGDLQLGPDGRRHAFLARGRGEMHVLHDRGTQAFDLVLPQSLVFDHRGRRWACLAGERRRHSLFVAVEERGRIAFDSEELVAAVMRSGGRPTAEIIRHWVAAELALMERRRRHAGGTP